MGSAGSTAFSISSPSSGGSASGQSDAVQPDGGRHARDQVKIARRSGSEDGEPFFEARRLGRPLDTGGIQLGDEAIEVAVGIHPKSYPGFAVSRWRRASYRMSAALVAVFSDSTGGCIGIVTRTSAASTRDAGRPRPSPPTQHHRRTAKVDALERVPRAGPSRQSGSRDGARARPRARCSDRRRSAGEGAAHRSAQRFPAERIGAAAGRDQSADAPAASRRARSRRCFPDPARRRQSARAAGCLPIELPFAGLRGRFGERDDRARRANGAGGAMTGALAAATSAPARTAPSMSGRMSDRSAASEATST